MPHLLGKVDRLFDSDVPSVFNVFLILSLSGWFLDGFDGQSRGRRYPLQQDGPVCPKWASPL